MSQLTLILRQPALSVKVVLQESDIRLRRVLRVPELLVRRLGERRRLDVLDYPLLCVDDRPVLLGVLCEIDCR